MTHISYTTAVKLKAFLGESAPEPMGNDYWGKPTDWGGGPVLTKRDGRISINWTPAYRLEDLLSKAFCEAFVREGKVKFGFDEDEVTDFIADWSTEMAYAYWNGGLPAVEKELCEMMEGR